MKLSNHKIRQAPGEGGDSEQLQAKSGRRLRSRMLKLSLMGAAGVLASGCSEPQQDGLYFSDADECIDSGMFEPELCQSQYQKALALSEQESPRYATRNICESDFGYENCRPYGSYWQPLMAGYMMGAVSRGLLTRPLYRSADDYFWYRTSGNYRVGSIRDVGRSVRVPSSVMTTVPKSSRKVLTSKGSYGAKAKTISRGGFGSKSAARGGWGS